MVKIKVCGLTRRQDIEICLGLGVDRLGLVFASSSRQISLAQLDQLLPLPSSWTAVVVDPDPSLVEALLERGCPRLQLHGEESPDFCRRYQGRVQLVKALRVSSDRALDFTHPVQEFLLDAPCPGSGQLFDWNLIQRQPPQPWWLAGGLHCDNVVTAIRKLCPYGVDVSSGVESAPGLKDPERLRRFVEAVRSSYS